MLSPAQHMTLLACQLLQYYSGEAHEILPTPGTDFPCSDTCLPLTLGSSNMLALGGRGPAWPKIGLRYVTTSYLYLNLAHQDQMFLCVMEVL